MDFWVKTLPELLTVRVKELSVKLIFILANVEEKSARGAYEATVITTVFYRQVVNGTTITRRHLKQKPKRQIIVTQILDLFLSIGYVFTKLRGLCQKVSNVYLNYCVTSLKTNPSLK